MLVSWSFVEQNDCLDLCVYNMSLKPLISTHILDTTKGQPAAGVDVTKIQINTGHFAEISFSFGLEFVLFKSKFNGLNEHFIGITV